jgi:hypothetical protein
MNDTSTSDLVEHRWIEAVKHYVSRVSAKWKEFVSLQEGILELRRKHDSYRTIAEILCNINVPVSHVTVRQFCRQVSKSMPRRGHHVHLQPQLPSERRRLTDADKEKRPVSCEARRLARDPISGAVKVWANLGRDIGFGKP